MFNHDRATLAEILNLEKHIDQGNFEDVAGYVKKTLGVKNVVYFSPSLNGYSYANPYCDMTYTAEWEARYRSEGYMHIDPVFQKGIKSFAPVDWGSCHRHDRAVDLFFNEAENFGIGSQGLTIPVRFNNGKMSALFTVTADYSDRDWASYRKKIMKDTMIFANYFHARVHERLSKSNKSAIHLTKREKEVITWAAEGKTIEDVASILLISRETAKAHLDTIRHKVNALNTTHAVSILHRHGLL
jgi:DNA-binding CsgD family transcriptional regulator